MSDDRDEPPTADDPASRRASRRATRDAMPASKPAPPEFARHAPQPDDPMPDFPTRREIDAELRAAEARTEARLAQFNSAMEVRAAATDHKIDMLIAKVDMLSVTIAEVRAESKAESRVTRTTVWGIGVALIGIVVGLWALGFNIQSNTIAAFQAGLAAQSAVQATQPGKSALR